MILEHAVLRVSAGREADFEQAFREAVSIVEAAAGFRSLRLERCIDVRGRYLLLVEWDRVEDDTEGFRRSAGYQRWKDLLHGFYDAVPAVEHYESVLIRFGT